MQTILAKMESYFGERAFMTKEKEHVKVPRWVLATFSIPVILLIAGGAINLYMTGDLVKNMQEVRVAIINFTAITSNHDARLAAHDGRIFNLEQRRFRDYR
jgi:hypothetical protein